MYRTPKFYKYIYTNLPITCFLIQKNSSHVLVNDFFKIKFCIILPTSLFLVVVDISQPFCGCYLSCSSYHLLMNDTLQLQQNIFTDINLSYHFGKTFRKNMFTIRQNKPNYNWLIFLQFDLSEDNHIWPVIHDCKQDIIVSDIKIIFPCLIFLMFSEKYKL